MGWTDLGPRQGHPEVHMMEKKLTIKTKALKIRHKLNKYTSFFKVKKE